MLALLFACAPISTAQSGTSDTLVELDVEAHAIGSYTADASTPGAVIVACDYESGARWYGPSADPRIGLSWSPEDGGYYAIGAEDGFVECHLWRVK